MIVALLALFAGVAMTQGADAAPEAPQGAWVGTGDPGRWDGMVNANEWSPKVAREFPGCHPLVEGVLSESVVVIWESGHVSAIPTDRAFALAEHPGAYDFWTVGQCGAEAVAA